MTTLVLTVIGDDRSGLVNTVAKVVAEHGGNWHRSEMTELAGKFAGIVEVQVPDPQQADLMAALQPLDGLAVAVETGSDDDDRGGSQHTLRLLGNDRPGILQDVSHALSRSGVSIDRLTTVTSEAPMAGGLLFEATVQVRLHDGLEVTTLREELEDLAGELMVDITFEDADYE